MWCFPETPSQNQSPPKAVPQKMTLPKIKPNIPKERIVARIYTVQPISNTIPASSNNGRLDVPSDEGDKNDFTQST